MSAVNKSRQPEIHTETKPYAVCFVGMEEKLQALLVDILPDAYVLSFTMPTLPPMDLDKAAVDLLDYLQFSYISFGKEMEWHSIPLVSMGMAGFIVKQAMNLASTERHRELALLVSDLIFIETPHRIPKGSDWTLPLEAITGSSPQSSPYKDLGKIQKICDSFLFTARKHRIVNVLAPGSGLVIDGFDHRILEYWLEINIVLTGDLAIPGLGDRLDDLDRLHQVLTQPRMAQPGPKFPVRDYLAFLSDLSWSWHQMGDYGYHENDGVPTPEHFNNLRLDNLSPFFQLIGPPGYGKKTLLRQLAFARSRNLQTTTVVLVKEDFASFQNLQMDVIKSSICQILWQRPFIFRHLKDYLETFTHEHRWSEPSLWVILRFLCQTRWIGTIGLYITELSGWSRSLQPLLKFLHLESLVPLRVVSTNKTIDLTGLSSETVVIDVLANCDWDNGVASIIHSLLPTQSWLGNPLLKGKVQEKLQECRGNYLTASLYLKQVCCVTTIPIPAALENSLDDLTLQLEQIYYRGIEHLGEKAPEVVHWCSQVLSWILGSCRPLTVRELSVEVAISSIDPGNSLVDTKRQIPVEMWQTLRQHLGLFLRREGDTILLIHETARDSLLSCKSDRISLQDHSCLARVCLEYLLFFLPDVCDSILQSAEECAFLAYAARYWPCHFLLATDVNAMDPLLDSLIHSLLSSSSLREKWYRLFHGSAIAGSLPHTPTPTHLEVASELGLLTVVQKVLAESYQMEISGHELQTSLQLATAKSHEHVVRLLLCSGAPSSPSLSVASAHNRLSILEQLLDYQEESQSQIQAEDITSALQYASRNGSVEALHILLRFVKGKMPGFDLVSNIPLKEAAEMGHSAIMELLLQQLEELQASCEREEQTELESAQQTMQDALIAACRQGGENPVRQLLHLQWGIASLVRGLETAAESGHTTIVRTLLSESSSRDDLNSRLDVSCALLKAAGGGYLDIVSLLVEAGSPISFADADGETPLHKAVRHGHRDTTQYLVSHGADTQRRNDEDLTPPLLAAQHGSLSVFRAVQELSQPTDFNSYIETAARNGHVLIIRHLLRQRPDLCDATKGVLGAALVAAASKGYLAVVQELEQAHVDINSKTGESSALHKAACNGHRNVVEYLLSRNADVDARDQLRRVPLHESVKYPGVLAMLIKNGSDVEATDLDDLTPLHLAVNLKEDSNTAELEKSISILLESGADVTAKNEDDNTALHFAAKYSFGWAAEALLSHQINFPNAEDSFINSMNSDCQTALHLAAESGDSYIVERILQRNNSMIDTLDGPGKSPLAYATDIGNLECIRSLLDKGANINGQDEMGRTALGIAAAGGRSNIVKVLLDSDADTEIANKQQETPLFCAIENEHSDLVIMLVNHGARIEPSTSYGWTPLVNASYKGLIDIVGLLISKGANVENPDKERWGPLALASMAGHYEVVRFLIERGADIEASTHTGWRPLRAAASGGFSNIVQLLIDRKADLEGGSPAASTALGSAAANGHCDTLSLLIERGANVEPPRDNGETPLILACAYGQLEASRLLLSHGARLNAADTDGWTPLYYALYNEHYDVAQYLIDIDDLKINAKTSSGETPLLLAVRKGQPDIVQLLLRKGADPSTGHDKYGFTSLHIAVQSAAVEIASILVDHSPTLNSCTDFCGKTPLDWLPTEKADAFFNQIPSLKDLQSTGQNDRQIKTKETLIKLITNMEDPDAEYKASLLYHCRFYLVQLGDMPSALRSMIQRGSYEAEGNTFGVWAFCDMCGTDLSDHGYFCTTCAHTDLCADCFSKPKSERTVPECYQGHEFQEVRAPESDGDDGFAGVESLDSFLADMRAKYGSL